MRSDEAERAFDDGRREGRLEALAEMKERERTIRKEVWGKVFLLISTVWDKLPALKITHVRGVDNLDVLLMSVEDTLKEIRDKDLKE